MHVWFLTRVDGLGVLDVHTLQMDQGAPHDVQSTQNRKTKRKQSESDDSDDAGSLKDFIVDDESNASDDEKKAPKRSKQEDEADALKTLEDEAKQFAGSISGTVVGGRTLRSREPAKVEARKPKDEYYERFGRAEEARLLEKFTKKDIIEFIKTLEDEWRAKYEAEGHVWPKLTARMSLDAIREQYDSIKAFAGLPDSDDEGSEDDDEGSDDEGSNDDDDEGSDDSEEASEDDSKEASEDDSDETSEEASDESSDDDE